MRHLAHGALIIGVSAFFAGCTALRQAQDDMQPPSAIPQASALASRNTSSKYKVVYSFGVPPDGGCSTASLINVGGTLYGTTSGGGEYAEGHCGNCGCGGGTVFSVTTGGTENVLHNFGNYPDGSIPLAGLVDVGGTLYGTTRWGGQPGGGGGTIYSVTTSGTEKVLHTFVGRRPDGMNPDAPLIALKGKLYGTTSVGGKHSPNGGTVFTVTTGGTLKVLHFFGGSDFGGPEGGDVEAALINVGGMFYGTAYLGGTYQKGVVFSLTPSGKEKVLHSFGNGTDGAFPDASLTDVNGTLYGTTEYGGTYKGGTVFTITPSGTEEVLHNFGNGTDGDDPTASLIDVNGTLYGTTRKGGTYCTSASSPGCGTIFSITTAGSEQVLYSFAGTPDGVGPAAALIELNGTLYGTTQYGGTSENGTIFAFTP